MNGQIFERSSHYSSNLLPPQDHTYVTKTVPLNADIQVTKDFLKKLYASGGGDGPEAVTAAMAEVLRMVRFLWIDEDCCWTIR